MRTRTRPVAVIDSPQQRRDQARILGDVVGGVPQRSYQFGQCVAVRVEDVHPVAGRPRVPSRATIRVRRNHREDRTLSRIGHRASGIGLIGNGRPANRGFASDDASALAIPRGICSRFLLASVAPLTGLAQTPIPSTRHSTTTVSSRWRRDCWCHGPWRSCRVATCSSPSALAVCVLVRRGQLLPDPVPGRAGCPRRWPGRPARRRRPSELQRRTSEST